MATFQQLSAVAADISLKITKAIQEEDKFTADAGLGILLGMSFGVSSADRRMVDTFSALHSVARLQYEAKFGHSPCTLNLIEGLDDVLTNTQ